MHHKQNVFHEMREDANLQEIIITEKVSGGQFYIYIYAIDLVYIHQNTGVKFKLFLMDTIVKGSAGVDHV